MRAFAALLSLCTLAACSSEPPKETVTTFGFLVGVVAEVRPGVPIGDEHVAEVRIVQVLCDSPAAAAELYVGDEVLALDGQILRGMSIRDYAKLSKPRVEGQVIQLEIDSLVTGKRLVTIVTKEMLPTSTCGTPPQTNRI